MSTPVRYILYFNYFMNVENYIKKLIILAIEEIGKPEGGI